MNGGLRFTENPDLGYRDRRRYVEQAFFQISAPEKHRTALSTIGIPQVACFASVMKIETA
jgi:hypothetical protein